MVIETENQFPLLVTLWVFRFKENAPYYSHWEAHSSHDADKATKALEDVQKKSPDRLWCLSDKKPRKLTPDSARKRIQENNREDKREDKRKNTSKSCNRVQIKNLDKASLLL